MRIVLLAPAYNAQTPGESWSTYKWVEGICARCECVVLTQHRQGWNPERSPLNAKLLVNWTEPKLPGMTGRIAWELKPGYVFFYRRARKWLKDALSRGERFDLIHQINPLALRYPCPARGLGVPYVMGPLAGSLTTPKAFREDVAVSRWYRALRGLDSLRLRHDPWLKDSYANAAAVIGVAPYVRNLIASCAPRRFEIMAETGVEQVDNVGKPAPRPGQPLRLLFVGRLIRTKGIIEAIESVAIAAKRQSITFDIVGTGDLAAECEQLISRLDLGGFVRLHGRLPKDEVFRWYDRSDVFLFPSYREPSGNVVFEAMSKGVPVITSALGGPGHVVTDDCGIRITPTGRSQYISDLASAIVALASNPNRLPELSAGALKRATETALWPDKIKRMLELYGELLRAPARHP